MEEANNYTTIQKILYVLAGALLTGAMWRARGTHGWGSEWGVFTVGLLLMVYIYAVFQKKNNASFVHIVAGATACMLTTPAWGTLLNQMSGYFEAHAVDRVASCTPLSGMWMMLCLGFGMLPLFMFVVSRLFSEKKYTLWQYAVVLAVFFGLFYLFNATLSHGLIRWIQPESVAAFESGLKESGKEGTAYSVYLKHFTDLSWAKKISFGRNYFTEVEVVSRAFAALVTAIVLRFVFKDKVGAEVMFFGCTAFSLGNTLANTFFVLMNKLGVENHPWLAHAWSYWEFSTGFFAAAFLLTALFIVAKKHPESQVQENVFSFLPERLSDVLSCLFVFVFGFGLSLLRPVATRLDASDVLPIVVYAVGGVLIAGFAVLMFLGKLPKVWQADASAVAPKLSVILFSVHMAYYMFVGYTQACLPSILIANPVRTMMVVAVPLFYLIALPLMRKELFKKA